MGHSGSQGNIVRVLPSYVLRQHQNEVPTQTFPSNPPILRFSSLSNTCQLLCLSLSGVATEGHTAMRYNDNITTRIVNNSDAGAPTAHRTLSVGFGRHHTSGLFYEFVST